MVFNTNVLRQIDEQIAALEERNKSLRSEISSNSEVIDALKTQRNAVCAEAFEFETPDTKSVRVDGLTITRVDLTSYEGFDLGSRSFSVERKQFQASEAEALRRKADLIEKGEEKVSESGFLKFLLNLPTGQKKLEKFKVVSNTFRVRGL